MRKSGYAHFFGDGVAALWMQEEKSIEDDAAAARSALRRVVFAIVVSFRFNMRESFFTGVVPIFLIHYGTVFHNNNNRSGPSTASFKVSSPGLCEGYR